MSAIRPAPFGAVALAALAPSAAASEVTYQTTIPGLVHNASGAATLPQFDPALGVLRGARFSVEGAMTGTFGIENTAASAASTGILYVGASVGWRVNGVSGDQQWPAFVPPPSVIPAYDGSTDFGGASGVTYAFSGATGAGGPQSLEFLRDFDLGVFVGTGTVAVDVPGLQVSSWVAPSFARTDAVTVDAMFTVRYEYDPLPTVICRALLASGCPCANMSALGHGCGNSANGNGGALTLTGAAWLASDTLTLHGSGMTNSSALYFQGTSFGYVQVPYGDGLRCVGGTLVRLGTRTNAGGASQTPLAGGAPISQVGGVTQPGTRYYQVFYRDVQSYCTSETFNVTSGLAILWRF